MVGVVASERHVGWGLEEGALDAELSYPDRPIPPCAACQRG